MNNYFENMLGETVNVKEAGSKYAQLIIIREKMPYFSTDKISFTKIEILNDNAIRKYMALDLDNNNASYKPDSLYMNIISTGDEEVINNNLNKKINRQDFNEQVLLSNLQCRDI